MVAEEPYPVPDTVTVEPQLALVGLKVIAGVTVNVVEPEYELASVTMTVSLPAGELGTTKVALVIVPVLEAVVVPPRITAWPLNLAVIVEEAEKPIPEKLTVEPTFPLVWFRKMDGVTMNAALAVFAL